MEHSPDPSEHLTTEELEAGFAHILRAPSTNGALQLIVRRPGVDQREVLAEADLDVYKGLVGDDWKSRGSASTPDGAAHPDAQVTLINARLIGLLAGAEERWQLSGDQLVVDLDISVDNLPPGARLSIGEAVIEVTEKEHTGCAKFAARFGRDALRFISTRQGRDLRLRGVYTRVVKSGRVRAGDLASRL